MALHFAAEVSAAQLKLGLYAAFALLCVLFVAHRVWIYLRLRHVQGPLTASLWKGWMLRHTLSGCMNLELKKVCDRYGKCCHLSTVRPSFLPSFLLLTILIRLTAVIPSGSLIRPYPQKQLTELY